MSSAPRREVRVTHDGSDRWAISLGNHVIHVDQPEKDSAPTPLELLVGSLTACVAHYARGYLVRHALPAEGLSVTAHYERAGRPARVGAVALRLTLPEGVPAERHEALLAVASACTVHNTLTHPPVVEIGLSDRVLA